MGNKLGLLGVLRGWGRLGAWAPLCLCMGLTGCRAARIPYQLDRLEVATRARHPLRVAILPFVDDRDAAESEAEDGFFSYAGLDYEPTDLSELEAPPGFVVAELLARHLVRSGAFKEVVLVREAADAPEAQLLLRGRIRRARGYVEVEGQREPEPPTPEHRRVIAEVFLADVELVEPGPGGRRLLHADLGWSILEERPAAPAVPSPWQVLGEALFESHQQLDRLLHDAVLDGSFVAPEETGLVPLSARTSTKAEGAPALGGIAPQGWRFNLEAAPSAPEGWRAEARCEGGRFEARQTQRFHRVLGPYRPTVRVWLCPAELALALDHRVEFPAVYLGRTPKGLNVFTWRLGPSSWRRAEAELGQILSVQAPASKYVFKVEPASASERSR